VANFKDNNGGEWSVKLDAPTILDIRAAGDPDFLKGDPTETIARLEADPVLLCGVIWVLCKKQATERSMSQEQFYSNLVGDAIESASNAFLDALLFFTPSRDRELMEVRAAKNKAILAKAREKALAKISDPALETAILAEIDAKLDAAIGQMLSSSATNLPESLA